MIDCVTIGGATLYHADAFDVFPDLRGEADMIATDPPYRLSSGGTRSDMGGIFDPEVYDNSGELMDTVQWHDIGGPMYRACKPDADAYVMTNDGNLFAAGNGLTGAGWKRHRVLPWVKNSPVRSRYYMNTCEFTLYLWKGKARDIRNGGSLQHSADPRPRTGRHPTEKPVGLMMGYIRNSSDPGDLVLDPFMGSGTTVEAAMRLGRRAIGIEIDPDHFETARKRIEAVAAIAPEPIGALPSASGRQVAT